MVALQTARSTFNDSPSAEQSVLNMMFSDQFYEIHDATNNLVLLIQEQQKSSIKFKSLRKKYAFEEF